MDSLTVHGLPRIFLSKRLLPKLIWATIFVFACSLLGLFLHERVVLYTKRHHSIKMERTTSSSMNFPTLTICDTDRMYDEQSLKFSDFPEKCNRRPNGQATELFRYGCKLFTSNVSFSCTYDFRSRCRFPEHFAPSRSFYQCFTFNKNGTLVQSVNERNYGIDLLLYKNPNEGTTFSIDNNPLRKFSQGLLLLVHSPDEEMGIALGNSVALIPGFQIEISLIKKDLKRLPAPFASNCSSKTTVKQLIGGKYNRKNCLSSCSFNQIYEKCGKVTEHAQPYMPQKDYPTTKTFINQSSYNECRLKNALSNGNTICDCPFPCEQVTYEKQVTQRPWQASSLTKTMKIQLAKFLGIQPSEVNLNLLKENFIHLKVFFDDFTTLTIVEQEMYNIESLLCDFGGLMGLLVGASAISLLEILCLLAQALWNRFRRNKVMKISETELVK